MATPAIDAATTVATSTRATTSAERRPDASGLRRKSGLPREARAHLSTPCRGQATQRRGPFDAETDPQRMAQRRERPEHGDRLVGQVLGGDQHRTGQPLTMSSSSVAGTPVRCPSRVAHHLEAAHRLPRPQALDSGLLGVGECPAPGLDGEIERGEARARVARLALNHPNVR